LIQDSAVFEVKLAWVEDKFAVESLAAERKRLKVKFELTKVSIKESVIEVLSSLRGQSVLKVLISVNHYLSGPFSRVIFTFLGHIFVT
jgi:hypothetical protein